MCEAELGTDSGDKNNRDHVDNDNDDSHQVCLKFSLLLYFWSDFNVIFSC